MNDNKKIIIVVILIIVLVGTIYFLNGGSKKATQTAGTTDQSPAEARLTSILSSIEGVGATNVLINENDGEISGVVIVCEGADSIIVKNDILNAVSTALNIEKNKIAIYSMNM